MRKGREWARKGEEMAGWDEDELVGSQRMINGREERKRRRRVRDHLTDLALVLIGTSYFEGKKMYIYHRVYSWKPSGPCSLNNTGLLVAIAL